MKNMMKWFMAEEDGQGMVEYALLIALLAVGCIAMMKVLVGSMTTLYENAKDAVEQAT